MAGSRYHGTFVGRPVREIVAETARVSTNADNLFERASAVRFLGYKGTLEAHTRAGEAYDESGDVAEAGRILDEAYARVRQGGFEAEAKDARPAGGTPSWDDLAVLARRGHEIASHFHGVDGVGWEPRTGADLEEYFTRHDLTDAAYDLPLTLRTEVPAEWTAVEARQGGRSQRAPVGREGTAAYVRYQAMPNAEDVALTEAGAPTP